MGKADHSDSSKMRNRLIQPIIRHVLAMLVMVLVVLAFVPDILQDRAIYSGDKLHYTGMSRDVKYYHEKTGKLANWTDRGYSGMPSTMVYAVYPSNVAQMVINKLIHWTHPQFVYLFLPMLCLYIALSIAGYPMWSCVLGAVIFGLSTVNIGNVEATHSSKVKAIATSMPIIIGVFLAFKKQWIRAFVLVALFTAFNVAANHFQITYYTILICLLIALMGLMGYLKNREFSAILKTVVVLLLAGLVGVLPNVSMLWSNYDFMKDSVRGEKIVNLDFTEEQKNGLKRDYANIFSHSFLEIGTILIPRIIGGSSSEWIGSSSESYQYIKRTGIQGTRIQKNQVVVPLFWGDKPLNGAPTYLGALVLLLAAIGLILGSKSLKRMSVVLILFTIIVAMGNHIDFINRFLFDYLPLFNRFRAPSMILGITAGMVAWLAVDALTQITSDRTVLEANFKKLLIGVGLLGSICFLLALIGPSMFDFSWDHGSVKHGLGMDESLKAQLLRAGNPETISDGLLEAFRSDRASAMRADSFRTLLFLALGGLCIYGYYKRWFKTRVFAGLIVLFLIIDLFGINNRYLNKNDFVINPSFSKQYPITPADRTIDRIRAPYDRMVDITSNVWQDGRPCYYHATIGGNNGAKLRRYQDLIDFKLDSELNAIRSGSKQANVQALNMLNLRFIKTGKGPKDYMENITSLGYAWFVDSVLWAADSNQELTLIDSLDRTQKAIIHQEFEPQMNGFVLRPSMFSKIELTFKEPGRIVYQTSTDVERLLVMSEIWYKGNEYWNSSIDGVPVDHIRANYLLRAIRVPAGKHEIVFEYHSLPFEKGEPISAAGSALLILSLISVPVAKLLRKKKGQDLETSM